MHSLQFQLLALYLLFAVPVTAAGMIFDRVGAERLQEQATNADIALANAIAFETQTSLQGALDTISRFSRLPYVQVLDREKLEQTFRAAVSPQEPRTLFFLWWDGSRFNYYITIPYSAVLDDPSFTTLPVLKTALNSETILVSDGWRMEGESGPVAIVFQRWYTVQDGGRVGIVGMVVHFSELSNKLTLLRDKQKGRFSAVVLDSGNQIVASSELTTLEQLPMPSSWPQYSLSPVSAREGGYWIEQDKEANPTFLYSFAPVSDTGWRVVLRRNAQNVFALSNDFHNGLLVAISFYLVCGVVFWWLVYRRIVWPLEQLKTFSYSVMSTQTQGASSSTPPPILERLSIRADEIGNLTVALQSMEHDLQMRLRDLTLLFETGRVLASSLKPDEVFELILDEVSKLLNVAGCAIVEIPPPNLTQSSVQIKQEKLLERAIEWNWIRDAAAHLGKFTEGQFVEGELNEQLYFNMGVAQQKQSRAHHVLLLALAELQHNAIVLVAVGPMGSWFSQQEIRLIRSFSHQATLAVKNAKLYNQSDERLKQKIADLTALHEIALAINSSLELNRALEQIAGRTTELTGTDWCTIRLVDGNNETVYLAAQGEIDSEATGQGYAAMPSSFALKNTVTYFFRTHADRTHVALHSNEPRQTAKFPTVREVMQRTGASSYLGVPLRWQHEVIGTLNIYSIRKQQFGDDAIQLLTILANQAAAAIVNARLYQEVAGEKSYLEAITQSMEEGLLLEDNEGQVVYANKVWCAALEQPAGSLVGWKSQDVLNRLALLSDRPTLFVEWEKSIRTEPPALPQTAAFEFSLGRSDMRMKRFHVTAPTGDSVGHGWLLQDITREKELDRVKSQLISTVSHELRTPLAIIKGNASSLLQTDVVWDAAGQREFVENIVLESDKLARLVSDLLDLSRLELGKSILNKQMCQLDDVVQEVIREVQQRSGRAVNFQRLNDVPLAELDRKRVQVVVRNLLENAFKYTPDRTPIGVQLGLYSANGHHAHDNGGHQAFALVAVEDHGTGIPADEKDHIFDRFYRLDSSYTRAQSGVGLGLAICRAFVEAHGGRIWVEDAASGTGSIFKFTLPLTGGALA